MADERKKDKTVRLAVGFYPDYWYYNYGISFDEKYFADPETRVEAQRVMARKIHEKFGEYGLGHPNPPPKPLITYGMVMLPAVFGCEIVMEKDKLPWANPLNLDDDAIMRLEVPDILNTSPMKEMVKQMDYLEAKYGKIVGDINTTGVLNLAMKLLGEDLYVDMFEKPEIVHRAMRIAAEAMIPLFKYVHARTGTGAVDVTPMADPALYVEPACSVVMISGATYEEFVLPYVNMVAGECHPFGIHHCGSIDAVVNAYAKVKNLAFMEIGFVSNVARARKILGYDVAANARIDPVKMLQETPDVIREDALNLIRQGRPYHNYSIDAVGCSYGTPDENVRAAYETVGEFGGYNEGEEIEWMRARAGA